MAKTIPSTKTLTAKSIGRDCDAMLSCCSMSAGLRPASENVCCTSGNLMFSISVPKKSPLSKK